MPESTSPTLATNTLTITNLEAEHFEEETMLKLKAKVESFGEVYYFAPIKSFYRVFVVYHSTLDAEQTKAQLHNTTFEGTTIRVYFGQHTEISEDPATRYLHPPELEKNWLISPPGSPPIGWSQVREDPPNSVHLADDLVKALLEIGQPIHQLPRPDGSYADRSYLFEQEVDDFSLDEPQQPQEAPLETEKSITDAVETNQKQQDKLSQQASGLKVDTKPLSSVRSSSPLSVSSPASSLFPPSTPTVLAFSPAKESEGDQPCITVQDWGIEEVAPRPLMRKGTIPKTALPTGLFRQPS
ncbi:carbohydrate-binding module 1 protein [Mortierella sp. AD011]|nr:carbohydrate-binding module 1 protein [Mortierella sp. AD010]KAF9401600.1 carbohydrate-binding module 1 protein [Mortierella sp. AD011]